MEILTPTEIFAANRRDFVGPGTFRRLAAGPLRAKWNVVLLLGVFVAGLVGEMKAQTRPPAFNETQLKALFLLNFARFVKWPPRAFTSADSPIVIGVLGADPFGALLDELVKGEQVEHRQVEVARFRRAEDIKTVHVLFVSSSEAGRLEQVFRTLMGKPILTVGDVENFERRGGIIRFLTEDKKVRLRVNLDASREADLQISSKLLRPAEIVGRKEGN